MAVDTTSYWVHSTAETDYPTLERDIDVDVAVLGGGIVGITAALLAQRAGLKVALVEMRRIAAGATGYTTAKITSGHSSLYRALERNHGVEATRLYAEVNEAGLEQIARLVEETHIECDFERKANYVYAESESRAKVIVEEAEAASRAGLQCEVVSTTTLPYPVACAVRIENQAQFHPRKYLLTVAHQVVEGGGMLFERTRATGLTEGNKCEVATSGGTIRASHVVVATHYPYLDRALLFPRVHPKRSYAIAGEVDSSLLPDGMFISIDDSTRSIRTIPDGARTLLMVGGEGHNVGEDHDTEERYRSLETWARERFGMERVEYRWSAQDGVSVDLLPFVGVPWGSKNVFVATGFGKWGIANGTAAAKAIVDGIVGMPSSYADLWDPKRLTLRASLQRAVVENAKVPWHLLVDRVIHPQRRSLEQLAPGEAGIDDLGLAPVAGYRDDTGELHKVSAVCTHMGCMVGWNAAERSWDCPCHGSRFDIDGRVLEGPATKDLKRSD
jgi:glycine/D-amino acid oxidase-like deaminating enzyme/nitrite reductase/ring-hydroxylating ferredoxin subunit